MKEHQLFLHVLSKCSCKILSNIATFYNFAKKLSKEPQLNCCCLNGTLETKASASDCKRLLLFKYWQASRLELLLFTPEKHQETVVFPQPTCCHEALLKFSRLTGPTLKRLHKLIKISSKVGEHSTQVWLDCY